MDTSSPRTTVAKITPDGRAAVATLVVSGLLAQQCIASHFIRASGQLLDRIPTNRIAFGRWRRSEDISEDVVVTRRGKYEFEVCCHGGAAAASAIIQSLTDDNVTEVNPSTWIASRTPGRIETDAWLALAQAKTERTAAILLDQLRGALRRAIEQLTADIEAGETEAARRRLSELCARASFGQHLTKPWRITFAGEPNVGKSSLVNRLVGYDRAIVFDQPGTTRDVLNAASAFDGWPVELQDTAGLRDSDDALEREGVRRTVDAVAAADLAVVVFDAQNGSQLLTSLLTTDHSKAVFVANKQDLSEGHIWPDHVVQTSALTGEGIEGLIETLVGRLVPTRPSAGAPVPFTEHQAAQLQVAREQLDASNIAGLRTTLRALLA